MNRKKNNISRIFFNKITFSLAGLVVLVFISVPLSRNLSKQYRINAEIRELENEISKMEGKNKELNDLIGYLGSDQFVKEQARMNLNFKEQGEEVIVVSEKENGGSEPDDQKGFYQIKGFENQKPPEKVPNTKKWWDYFFKKK